MTPSEWSDKCNSKADSKNKPDRPHDEYNSGVLCKIDRPRMIIIKTVVIGKSNAIDTMRTSKRGVSVQIANEYMQIDEQ